MTENAAAKQKRSDLRANDLERVCPSCQELSPGDYERCGACGVPLIEIAFRYDPPTGWDDPRVCRNCVRGNGSWKGTVWYSIANRRTGHYHSGGKYGVTDCGIDATGDTWVWPL